MNERFEDIMSAISFAEAGEHDKARELMKGRDRVLLALSDLVFDRNVMKYAMSIAKRIRSCLDILYLTRTEANRDSLHEFMRSAESEGISCRLITTEGCMKKAILEYTEKRREVLFVIVGSTPELEVECRSGERTLTEAWKKLKCPLVVVSKGELPSTA